MQKTKLTAINSTVKEKHLAQSVISLQLAWKAWHLTPAWKTESKGKKGEKKATNSQKFSHMRNKFLFVVQELEFHQEGNFLMSAK